MLRAPFAVWLLAPSLLFTSAAVADPVAFSASGTVAATNEPDSTLYPGVAAAPAGSFTNVGLDGISRQFIALGHVDVTPSTGFNGGPWPNFTNTPFDILVNFQNANLPNLEIKGVFSGTGLNDNLTMSVGTVTQITSSAPQLNAALPAPFANMIANPAGAYIGVTLFDWNVSTLGVYAIYQPQTVPEPATLIVMAAGIVGLAYRRIRSR